MALLNPDQAEETSNNDFGLELHLLPT